MTPRRSLILVDLLRCAAALLVAAYHVGAALPARLAAPVTAMAGEIRFPVATVGATWWGWIGVEIFFVLSGLVIGMSAERSTAPAFLRRRALRLLPAAWIGAGITLAVVLALAPQSLNWGHWTAALVLLPQAAQFEPSWWTLTIEAVFYLYIAAVLAGGGGAARIERAALALGGASATFWLLATLADFATLADDSRFAMTLLPHGCFFALGVVIRAGLRDGWPAGRLAWLALLGAAGAAEIVEHARCVADALGIAPGPAAPLLAFAAALALLLAAGWLQPVLARRIGEARAAAAGRMTYPFYLLHQVTGAGVAIVLVRLGVTAGAASWLAIIVILVAAWLVAERAEPAVRGWLAALLTWRPARRQSAIA